MKTLSLLLFVCCSQQVYSQALKVDTTFSAEQLLDKFFSGKGMRVSNARVTGGKQSICYFTIDTNVIGMKKGLLLSTGNVYDVAQENLSPKTSGLAWNTERKGYKNDRDLNKVSHGRTFDHTALEFDFIPFNNSISFSFSFASEEYPEFAGSEFNDVFAFIISGGTYKKKNLAVIPGTKDPITVNTINHRKNPKLYINNNYFFSHPPTTSHTSPFSYISWFFNVAFNPHKLDGVPWFPKKKEKLNQALVSSIGFDGFTKVLKAGCEVVPGQVYHFKIAIGDVQDKVLDSGVFLEAGSFISEHDSALGPIPVIKASLSEATVDSLLSMAEFVTVAELPTAIEAKFEITNINFDFDLSVIPDTSKTNLDALADYLNANKELKLSLTGYTDNKGSKKYNQNLSEKRAEAVTKYLVSKNVAADRMSYTGNSFENPIATNESDFGRALNRRVELMVIE